jgi:hypothetical protein
MIGEQIRIGKKSVKILRALSGKSDENMQFTGEDNSKADDNLNWISAALKCTEYHCINPVRTSVNKGRTVSVTGHHASDMYEDCRYSCTRS